MLAFSGLLEETSRELFNETGLTSVVLEGKLFKHVLTPQPVSDSSASSAAASHRQTVTVGEETCMAVKVYLSLIPSSPAIEQQLQSPAKAAAADKGASPQKLFGGASGSVKISETDIDVIDHEILDFHGHKGGAERVDEAQQFNVVTEESAQPNELPGSSVLSVPLQVEPQQVTAPPAYGELPPAPAESESSFGENLDPKQILRQKIAQSGDSARSHELVTNNSFAEIVRAELVEKQKLVERLMEDVRVRTEVSLPLSVHSPARLIDFLQAIQVVGKDIRELREEKANLLVSDIYSKFKCQSVDRRLSTEQATGRRGTAGAEEQDGIGEQRGH